MNQPDRHGRPLRKAEARTAPAARHISLYRVLLTLASCMVGLIAAVLPAGLLLPGGAVAQNAAAGTEHFKPTASQLASLRIVTVARASFREEHVTDGRIALNADHTTPVFSPYSGRVVRVMAGLGDVVHAGQPLLAVQASEFVQGQSDLLAAQSSLGSAKAQLQLAQSVERRKHALYEAKAAALQDWEQSQSDLAAAQAAQRTAEAALAAVRNRLTILGKSSEEIDALAGKAAMDPVAYVLAPLDGTVTDRQVGPGQYLQAAASNPVYTIGDLSSVWLVANVRETDAPYIKKGGTLEVHVLALPEQRFAARITFVAPTLDPLTRRLTVRAEIANPGGVLKPEMFARFSVISGAASSAPAVPESGVLYEGEQARVWVAAADGSLELRRIRPGRSAGGLLEVLEGIKPGERVVSSGALFIDRAAQGD